jgi:hypothetical protein
MNELEHRIPIILLHESTGPAFAIFNPNDWSVKSKPIVNLCAVNYGLLIYTSKLITDIFEQAHVLCQSDFDNLRHQWEAAKWDLSKSNYFVDVPHLHLSIHAFLSTIKTFLDVIVQLISAEGLVSCEVHGFHKKGNNVGGQLLQILRNNATNTNKDKTALLQDLVIKHKELWIDSAVNNRDLLIHPEGFAKIMFALVLREINGELTIAEILKPSFGDTTFDKYAIDMLSSIEIFSKDFIKCVKNS